MPNLAETAPAVHEQIDEAPNPDALQPLGEFVANDRAEANSLALEQSAEAISATTPVPDQKIGSTILPEMPNSHPEVDASTISVNGLIKNCPHYAERYKRDPEGAMAEATKTAEKAQEVTTLREQGMSAKKIRAKMVADNLARAKEKARTLEKQEEPEPAKSEHSEQTTQLIESKPAETAQPVPERVAKAVVHAETTDKPAVPPTETPPPAVASPSIHAQTVESLHERPDAARHERADQALLVARQSVERAVVEAAKNTSGNDFEDQTILPDLSPVLAAEPSPHNLHRTILATETAHAVGHESSPSLKAGTDTVADAENTALIHELFYEDAIPESSLLDDSQSSTEIVTAEKLPVSSIATPVEELDEAVAQVNIDARTPQGSAESYVPTNVAEVSEQATWDDVLKKEPLELYEDFTAALKGLIAEAEILTEYTSEAPEFADQLLINQISNAELVTEETQSELVPVIAITVVERLSNLDAVEKEAVAAMLQGITTTIQATAASERGVTVETEIMEVVTAKLERQIITLFDALGIKYKPEDIQQFMRVLLGPDFQPSALDEEVIGSDLEHDGTHEAKLHLPHLTDDLVAIELELRHLLGKFVMFCTSGTLAGEYGYEL